MINVKDLLKLKDLVVKFDDLPAPKQAYMTPLMSLTGATVLKEMDRKMHDFFKQSDYAINDDAPIDPNETEEDRVTRIRAISLMLPSIKACDLAIFILIWNMGIDYVQHLLSTVNLDEKSGNVILPKENVEKILKITGPRAAHIFHKD